MVITDDFVYIHMPKTGGTFVEKALRGLLSSQEGLYIDTSTGPGRRCLGGRDQHQTVSEIPLEFRGRPIAFTVRNPYDHYVSFYEFAWWKDHPGDTFDEERIRVRYPQYPDITFREYLEAIFAWELIDAGYMEVATAERLQAAGVGLLTYDYIRFLFERPGEILENLALYLSDDRYVREIPGLCFLRMEELNRELYEFLVSVGHRPERVEFVLHMDKTYPPGGNRRATGEWTSYYTPVMKRLVREQERFLFRIFPHYDG